MSLAISRVLHAGYHFQSGHTKILFDPIFENPFSLNCYAYPSVRFDYDQIRELNLDAVFISHYHDDHCSFESLSHLKRQTPIFLYCQHREIFGWLRELGFRNVHSVELNQPIEVGDFKVIARAALDSDVDAIFEIHGGGVSVLNVVDAWIDPSAFVHLREVRWDMVLWPFQTMREIAVLAPSHAEPAVETLPPEWLEQLRMLNPRYVVPSSCQFIHEDWSWYNRALFPITYRQFEKEIREAIPQTEVVRMNPSVSLQLSSERYTTSAPLRWVHTLGEQNVDYQIDPLVEPTPTSEIARRFEQLRTEESASILSYCRVEILDRYRSLESSDEEFFDAPRVWKLSLYDHEGKATNFFYQIHRNKIELTEASSKAHWQTELPAAKLFSALNHGEALTSLYLRIVAEKKEVDVMQDPLVRCLFTGLFGGYQREQMKKLMGDRDESRDPRPAH